MLCEFQVFDIWTNFEIQQQYFDNKYHFIKKWYFQYIFLCNMEWENVVSDEGLKKEFLC